MSEWVDGEVDGWMYNIVCVIFFTLTWRYSKICEPGDICYLQPVVIEPILDDRLKEELLKP